MKSTTLYCGEHGELRYGDRFGQVAGQRVYCGNDGAWEECRDRGVGPITNNFKADQPAGKIKIPLIIPQLAELTRKPVTFGDHLHRRRIELGLYHKDVAAKLGVTTSTVWNWENRGSVDLRFIPRVIEFLGYDVNRHRKMTHHRRPILTHPSGLI